MWLALGRRLAVIVLAAAVAAGLFAGAVQAASQHCQAFAPMAARMDNGLRAAHAGCPFGQKANLHGACFAPCAEVSVLPSPMPAVVYYSVGQDVLRPPLDVAFVGRAYPPDPYPPKS